MIDQSAVSRTRFSDVAVGQRFLDSLSGEYFVKQGPTVAVMATGIGDGVDEFAAEEPVDLD
jgi:hypothetical protein